MFSQHLSDDLGVELPERAYGEDCSLTLQNLQETVLDEFVLAHVLGWWGKAMMIRNHFILWILSIAFECLELTFQVEALNLFRIVNCYLFSIGFRISTSVGGIVGSSMWQSAIC